MPRPFPCRAPAAALGLALLLLLAPAAAAAPDCVTPLPPVAPVLEGQGVLESVIVAPDGRLYYSDGDRKAIMRLARPGAAPELVAGGIDAPGGLAFDDDPRFLFVGQGDSVPVGLQAPFNPSASLLRLDVETGATTVYATGLGMANGVVRAADGTIYASDDVSVGIDRIAPGGAVQPRWSPVVSGNGMAIDRAQRRLFVNQTFVPAAVQVVDLADPSRPRTFARPGPEDIAAGLDGMDIDRHDRLVVTANLPGEVWRVGTDGAICVLGRGLANASAVAYGKGPAGTFAAGRLYGVGFGGTVAEIPAGFVPPPATPVDSGPGSRAAAVAAQQRARARARRAARSAAASARRRSLAQARRARAPRRVARGS